MSSKRWLVAACLCLPAAVTAPVLAQEPAQPTEITAKEWSYQAVQDLAARGLVHGYKDAKFLDARTLSRFEMATLVKRVIDSMLQIPVPTGKGAPVPETPASAASRGQGYEPPPLGRPISSGKLARTASFTESDLGTVKRLADAYSVELAVIGVNLQETMDKLGALEGRVEAIEESLRDPEGPLQTVINNVARIDKIRFSGYVQARYESFENTREAQGTPAASRPAVTDRFTLRRVRLVATARPTEKMGVRIQMDAAPGSVELRDAWIDYFVAGNPAKGMTATFGQFKVPFGFESIQSSSVREAPERSRVTRFFFPSERDRGAKLAGPTGGKVFWEVGVFNGTQPGRSGMNQNDNNNDKNFAARIRTTIAKRLDLGASINFGTTLRTALATGEDPRGSGPASASNPYENRHFVFGADAQWFVRDGTVIRAEFMKGRANGTKAFGYILQLIQNIGPKWQAVARYDWLGVDDRVVFPIGGGGTPIGDAVGYEGTASNLALGAIYQLDSSTRIKLFYEIHGHGRENLSGYGSGGAADRVPWQGNILRFEVITLF